MASMVAGALAAVMSMFGAQEQEQKAKQRQKHRQAVAHRRSVKPTQTALASWYDQEGAGACGYGDVQSGYRFASLILNCGTRIRICHRGCVTATMSDHGPYVAGRTFDLNANLRAVIACPDLCEVRWSLN